MDKVILKKKKKKALGLNYVWDVGYNCTPIIRSYSRVVPENVYKDPYKDTWPRPYYYSYFQWSRIVSCHSIRSNYIVHSKMKHAVNSAPCCNCKKILCVGCIGIDRQRLGGQQKLTGCHWDVLQITNNLDLIIPALRSQQKDICHFWRSVPNCIKYPVKFETWYQQVSYSNTHILGRHQPFPIRGLLKLEYHATSAQIPEDIPTLMNKITTHEHHKISL